MINSDRIQGRMWSLILWQDNRSLKECQDIITHAIDKLSVNHYVYYAYILHDKDTYITDDFVKFFNKNGCNPEWNVGDSKKNHYHIFIQLKESDKIDLNFVYNCFDKAIDKNYIQRINNDTMYIRYLIHCDNPDKYQYSEYAILTNIDKIDNYFLYNDYTSNTKYNFTKKLLEFVESEKKRYNEEYKAWYEIRSYPVPKKLDFIKVSKWCLENDFYDMLLKYSYLIKCLIDDRN